MALKANELRIGNWHWGDGNPIQITAKDILDLSDDPQDDFYQPIPLTEEWLLKFGFEKNKNNRFVLLTGDVDILFTEDLDGWVCDGINFSVNCLSYVHQLQNLYFALTGEELEMK
jgi:hypothetical protein